MENHNLLSSELYGFNTYVLLAALSIVVATCSYMAGY
jgi:hypothetical protein